MLKQVWVTDVNLLDTNYSSVCTKHNETVVIVKMCPLSTSTLSVCAYTTAFLRQFLLQYNHSWLVSYSNFWIMWFFSTLFYPYNSPGQYGEVCSSTCLQAHTNHVVGKIVNEEFRISTAKWVEGGKVICCNTRTQLESIIYCQFTILIGKRPDDVVVKIVDRLSVSSPVNVCMKVVYSAPWQCEGEVDGWLFPCEKSSGSQDQTYGQLNGGKG